eukprot:770930-Rhodomonas_salina.1
MPKSAMRGTKSAVMNTLSDFTSLRANSPPRQRASERERRRGLASAGHDAGTRAASCLACPRQPNYSSALNLKLLAVSRKP